MVFSEIRRKAASLVPALITMFSLSSLLEAIGKQSTDGCLDHTTTCPRHLNELM